MERDRKGACRVVDCDNTVRFRRGICSSCYAKWKRLGCPSEWPVLPKERTGPKPGTPQARPPKVVVATFAGDEDSTRRAADREDSANPEDELEFLRGGGARVLAKARVP
jgi:hypothetical protein